MGSRKMEMNLEDLITLLTNEYPEHTLFTKETQDKMVGIGKYRNLSTYRKKCIVVCAAWLEEK